jgi:hypothetical protein
MLYIQEIRVGHPDVKWKEEKGEKKINKIHIKRNGDINVVESKC